LASTARTKGAARPVKDVLDGSVATRVAKFVVMVAGGGATPVLQTRESPKAKLWRIPRQAASGCAAMSNAVKPSTPMTKSRQGIRRSSGDDGPPLDTRIKAQILAAVRSYAGSLPVLKMVHCGLVHVATSTNVIRCRRRTRNFGWAEYLIG